MTVTASWGSKSHPLRDARRRSAARRLEVWGDKPLRHMVTCGHKTRLDTATHQYRCGILLGAQS